MSIDNLKDVYIDQLQDIYSANRQSLKATERLLAAASNADLKDALQRGAKGIQDGIDALKPIIEAHGAKPTGEFCKGMEGLCKEVEAHVIDAEFGDDDARDAMIIAQYQRMVHYALAGYGCVNAYARRLDLNDDAATLQKCLDETYDGDRVMNGIAMGDVNKEAA